jgi:hypothetical protein
LVESNGLAAIRRHDLRQPFTKDALPASIVITKDFRVCNSSLTVISPQGRSVTLR